MRGPRPSLILLWAVVAAAVLTPGPGRHGEASALLALGTASPATFGTALGTSGTVDSAGGTVAVIGVGGWTIRVRGTDSGRLRTTCSKGTSVLANPLKLFAATGGDVTDYHGATSTTPLALTGSAQPVASGVGLLSSVSVRLIYRYTPWATDQLMPGCPYSQTTTIELYP